MFFAIFKGGNMSLRFYPLSIIIAALCMVAGPASFASSQGQKHFIGTESCKECHQEQYDNFKKYSKKAQSWKSIEIMRSNLKPKELEQCYECHTTGHGQPGGFVSIESTPALADVGCETCHGPGSEHAESGDPERILRLPTEEHCLTCHNKERVGEFDFNPLRYSGAH